MSPDNNARTETTMKIKTNVKAGNDIRPDGKGF
jgi:hypothetical protein